VKDGHSWFFETMAELGSVGTLLLIGFAALFLVVSIRDLRFLGKGRQRELYGAFFVASAMFLFHSMIDWDWEMPVVALTFFMFAGGLLRYGMLARSGEEPGEGNSDPSGDSERKGGQDFGRFRGWNWLLAAGCVAAIAVTIVPLVGAVKIQAANQLATQNDFGALERGARSAQSWNPLAADPLVLQALAKQGQGRLEEAEALLTQAVGKEPENDSIYRNLTRVYLQMFEAAKQQGDVAAQQELINKTDEAITKARALNPLEPRETGDLEIQARKIGVQLE
jgi:hypothetical protein